MTNALLIIAPRKPERFDEVGAAGAPGRAGTSRGGPSCASMPSRATTSSSSTPSASSPRSTRSRPWCSSAAASSTPAATISSNRRSSGSQSSLVRTCTTSPRSRARSSTMAAAVQVRTARELETGAARAARRSGRRASLGAAARALVEANRGAPATRASPRSRSCCRPRTTSPSDRGRVRFSRGFETLADVIHAVLSTLYAAVARRRRERYAARPDLRRRLRRPVISVGNLAVGGRGKTPLVGVDRAELLAMGERPPSSAAATRERARMTASWSSATRDGDPRDLDRAGDEPLMLARELPGASSSCRPIGTSPAASPNTSSAPRSMFSTTAFSTCSSIATSTSLIVGRDDIADPRDAAGRPPARAARYLHRRRRLIVAADDDVAIDVAGLEMPMFRTRAHDRGAASHRRPGRFRRRQRRVGPGVAGIARPQPFLRRSAAAGWNVVATRWRSTTIIRFRPPTSRRISGGGAAAGAAAVLTTEKDFVRLLPLRPFPVPVRLGAAYNGARCRLTDFRHWLAVAALAIDPDRWSSSRPGLQRSRDPPTPCGTGSSTSRS